MSKRSSSALVLAVVGASAWAIHRVGRRSGVSNEEVVRSLPGDHIVADPLWSSTRAITVDAPPSFVWPWLVQMGSPAFRAGWYTPHWLDELIWGERRRSAEQIVPGLQELEVGDRVPDSVDWSVYYVVEELEAERHLVLRSRSHVFPPITESDFTWAFALIPHGIDRTRLFIRARVIYRPLWLFPIVETALGVGDSVNATAMLRGIKTRAEGEYLR